MANYYYTTFFNATIAIYDSNHIETDTNHYHIWYHLTKLKTLDVNLYEKTILIYGKRAKERKIQIGNDAVLQILQEYKENFTDEIQACNHFFVNQFNQIKKLPQPSSA